MQRLATGMPGVLFLVACCAPTTNAAEVLSTSERAAWVVTLAEAVVGPKEDQPRGPLILYLERLDGTFVRTFATAPETSQVPHDVDASDLALNGGRLTGDIKVTLHADPWFPKDGKPLTCEYRLGATVTGRRIDGTYRGTFAGTKVRGTVSGRAEATPSLPADTRFELSLPGAIGLEKIHRWQRQALVGFNVSRGRGDTGRITAPGSSTYAEWTGTVDGLDVRFDGRRLQGKVAAAVVGDKGRGRHEFALEADVIAGAVAGRFVTHMDGKEVASGRFLGTVDPSSPPRPGEAVWTVELHGALADGKMLRAFVASRGGVFGRGFAFGPTFNRALHDVEASGLQADTGTLAGNLPVTIRPDPWVPKDHKPVACMYRIEATIRGMGIAGTFTGRYGSEEVQGPVSGVLAARPTGRPVSLWLKFEDGLTGASAWHNRAFVNVEFADGRPAGGRFFTNKGVWQGTLEGADIRLDGGRLRGTATGRVTAGRVRHGTYIFVLDGVVIGTQAAGDFVTSLDGKEVKRGRFLGGLERNE